MALSEYQITNESVAYFRSFEEATSEKRAERWQRLGNITVQQSAEIWLASFSANTERSYRAGLSMLADFGLLEPAMSLQSFSLLNHNAVVDRIKGINLWSECTRQARAACYISFTRFLHRWTDGVVPRVTPCREGASKTFFKVREKVATEAMTRAQWTTFLAELERINTRDCLIAKVILQGGKRVQEVLSLTWDRIDWESCEITFAQTKTRGAEKETVITYPEPIIAALRCYVGDRIGTVFITRTGSALPLRQLANTFAKAGRLAGIPFKVTPHVLRASTVTYLKQQGFSDSDIMRVTGHASAEMIYAYDKSSRAENASKKVSLVT